MAQTLTTERMEEIAKLATRLHHISGCAAVTSSGETIMHHTFVDTILSALHDVTAELLASREAQPAKSLELAGWQFKSVNGDWLGLIDEHGKNQAVREGCEVREVYAMTHAINDRDAVREAHAEWSQSTFGNVGPIGPLKHLSKEALEAAAQPDDLSEWADIQFLLWDAQRRAGITDEQIAQAMIEKLAVNKRREWPEPKDGEPRLHITAPPAPAVPDAVNVLLTHIEDVLPDSAWQLIDVKKWNAVSMLTCESACHAAMLATPVSQYFKSQASINTNDERAMRLPAALRGGNDTDTR